MEADSIPFPRLRGDSNSSRRSSGPTPPGAGGGDGPVTPRYSRFEPGTSDGCFPCLPDQQGAIEFSANPLPNQSPSKSKLIILHFLEALMLILFPSQLPKRRRHLSKRLQTNFLPFQHRRALQIRIGIYVHLIYPILVDITVALMLQRRYHHLRLPILTLHGT